MTTEDQEENVDLIDWAVRVSEFMATDKNNDWSEELAELNKIIEEI